MKTRGTGALTRMGIATQVGFTVLLALVSLILLNWLFGRPGFRQRIDLTSAGVNTLSTAANGVISRLEEPITIDVFYRSTSGPYASPLANIHERVQRTLLLMDHESENIVIHQNNVADRVALDSRRHELMLTGFDNCLVVSKGSRREVLTYSGTIAEIDPGRPTPQGYSPPRIVNFRAEAAIIQGILGVLKGSVPKVYFTRGHGERDLEELEDGEGYAKLNELLKLDGFETGWWQFDIDGPVPDDCAVLTILAPDSSFSREELDAVDSYLDGGGRVVVGAHKDPTAVLRSGLVEWLGDYGIELSTSIVCRAYFQDGRPIVGVQQNAVLAIQPGWMGQHPITTPLREGNRMLHFLSAHRVRLLRQPQAGVTRPIVNSGPNSWLDVPREGRLNFAHDSDSEEIGPHPLVVVSQFRPDELAGLVGPLEQKTETRIAVLGAASVLCNTRIDYNADFARNLFNWAVDRDYRVSISPHNPDRRRLPVRRTDVLARLRRVSVWGLPGMCLLLGLTTFILRNRGGKPRRKQ